MTTELFYLALVSAFVAVMWIPYSLNYISIMGLLAAVGYPEDRIPLSNGYYRRDPWAVRMKAAHSNAIENLVVFAVLVLVAHVAGISNEVTQMACVVYFWARVAHFVTYTLRIPWLRTMAFAVGFGCQIALACQLLCAA